MKNFVLFIFPKVSLLEYTIINKFLILNLIVNKKNPVQRLIDFKNSLKTKNKEYYLHPNRMIKCGV